MATGQGTKCSRNIAESFNHLSRVHERYQQTDDSQTDGRQHDNSEHSRSLNIGQYLAKL